MESLRLATLYICRCDRLVELFVRRLPLSYVFWIAVNILWFLWLITNLLIECEYYPTTHIQSQSVINPTVFIVNDVKEWDVTIEECYMFLYSRGVPVSWWRGRCVSSPSPCCPTPAVGGATLIVHVSNNTGLLLC